jgi:hypothetical protein
MQFYHSVMGRHRVIAINLNLVVVLSRSVERKEKEHGQGEASDEAVLPLSGGKNNVSAGKQANDFPVRLRSA